MKRHGIQHFASESEQKAAVVERVKRTINSRIWTYLSDRGSVRWVDVIQDLVDAYNSRHRSINMASADVHKKDENRLWVRLLWDGDTYLKPKNSSGSHGAGKQPQDNFWQGLHAKLDKGAPYSE